MKILRLTILLLLVSEVVLAQSKKQKCDCSTLLKETIQKVSTIYAGFDDKVTSVTLPKYKKLVTALTIEASAIDEERKCYETLKKYTSWFKDQHVGMWFGVQTSATELRKVSLSDVAKASANKSTDAIEGTWSTADKTEQYAIIKDKSLLNKYVAVTIKSRDSAWIPGMVKVEFYNYDKNHNIYRGMYYRKNFSGVLNGFTLKNDQLTHWFGQPLYRDSKGEQSKVANAGIEESVVFRILNKDFVYLKLGKFNQNDVDKLDSLIKTHRTIIRNAKNLILDLRGNPGGNSSSSQEMIRLIYTNPIIYPAWKYRSSSELINAKTSLLADLLKKGHSKRVEFEQVRLQKLKDQPGELVIGGDSVVRTIDSVNRYPERVALLVDKGSGSSAEFFTFESKQSKKVTLFGENTAGVMDYGEVQNFNLSCGNYLVSIPWGRNGWIDRFGFRIDNIGFLPDVPIPSSNKDWVQFIVDYWSK